MGYDLHSKAGYFEWNSIAWEMLLKLASLYGWQPAGTAAPRDWNVDREPWFGTYRSNDWQQVTASDAAALADALERSLLDLPDHDALENKITTRKVGAIEIRTLDSDAEVSVFEAMSGENKQHLRKFIAYCRQGPFRIG